MKSFLRRSLVPFLLLLGSAPLLWAENLHPIDTQMDLGLFGLLGGSMQYSVDGKKIDSYRDFKDLIYPLHDAEASDMIRDAQEKDFVADMFYVAGVASGVDMALAFKPIPYFHVDWLDRIASGLTAAEVVIGIGLVFDNSAEAEKFNAVQRYNQIIRVKDKDAWKVSPQLYANGDLGLGFSGNF